MHGERVKLLEHTLNGLKYIFISFCLESQFTEEDNGDACSQ